jgi:crotonobetainyl-CoA:carnitine CoA-transferase CaiB-like acyl-CoA transferase
MRVLELSSGAAASFAGLLLGELGVDVIKVEPTVPLDACRLDEGTHNFVNRRKRSVTLDLRRRAGVELMLRLVGAADGLVEDLGPGGLGRLRLPARRLRHVKPGFVVASIAPFGQTGPRAGWQSSELVVQAMGGMLYATGWDGEPPHKLAGHMAEFIAGLHAALAVFTAVYGVRAGVEDGAHIDISAQETFLQHWSRHIGQWTYNGTGSRRDRRTFDGQGVPSTAMAADGWLCLAVRNAPWDALATLLGLESFIGDEWREPRARVERWPEIEPHFNASMASRTRYDWFAAAAERGLIFGPVQDLHEVLQSEQYAARDYFKTAEIDGRLVDCPGLPFNWASQPATVNRPTVRGEHTDELLGELLGLSEHDLRHLRADGII